MPYSTQQVLLLLPSVPMGAAGIIGAIRFMRLPLPLRYLTLSIISASVVEMLAVVLWMKKIPNLFLYPFYIFAEFALLATMYQQAIDGLLVRRVIPWLIVAFGGYCLGGMVFGKQAIQFNSFQMFVETLLILALVVVFFYRLMHEVVVVRLERYPMFWVSAGLLIYFAGNSLIFISSNYLLTYSAAFNMKVWLIHATLCFILYSFYLVALCIPPEK